MFYLLKFVVWFQSQSFAFIYIYMHIYKLTLKFPFSCVRCAHNRCVMMASVIESFKDYVQNKTETFSSKRRCPHKTRLPPHINTDLFMGLNEWKYAFDRVLQWSIWDGKPQFCLELQRFFQTAESSLEMKAIKKKKTQTRIVARSVYFFLKVQRKGWFSVGKKKMCSVFMALLAVACRWHHWPRKLSQSSHHCTVSLLSCTLCGKDTLLLSAVTPIQG